MRINARADLCIRPIASGKRNFDKNFSGTGARFGHLSHDKLVRGTRLVDHNCLHLSLPTVFVDYPHPRWKRTRYKGQS